MRKLSETKGSARTDGIIEVRESSNLYSSRCTLGALAELLNEEPRDSAFCAASLNARVLEPFAVVVCKGFIASLDEAALDAVSIGDWSALPLRCGSFFTGEE